MPQRLGGEQLALRVDHFEERRAPGVVAQLRDLVRLGDLVAAVGFRRQHVARRAVGDERIVHFAERDLDRLQVFDERLVAPCGGKLDLRFDRLQRRTAAARARGRCVQIAAGPENRLDIAADSKPYAPVSDSDGK